MNTLADLLAHLASATPEAPAECPAGLDDSRLASFESEATQAFLASRPTGNTDLAAGRAAVTIKSWRAAMKAAADAAQAETTEIESLTAALTPEPVVEPVAPPAAAEPVVEVPAAVVSQTAANADHSRTAAETSPTPRRRRSMVAAVGLELGQIAPVDILDEDASHKALADSVSRLANFGGGGVIPMVPVLREVTYNLPENDTTVRLNSRMDARQASAQIERNTEDQRVLMVETEVPFAHAMKAAGLPVPTSRTAAVFCGPVANSFDVGITPTGGSPIYDSFPKDPSARGQFRFRPDLDLASFGTVDLDQPGIPWDANTNTGNQNGVTAVDCTSSTVCFTPGCLNDEFLIRMLMWKYCWRYQNTAEILDPEGIAAQMKLWDIARDKQREIIMQTYLQATAQADSAYYTMTSSSGTDYGGIPDFIRLVQNILAPAGWTGRFDAGAGYTLYMPERLGGYMGIDEISREFVPTTEALNTAAQLIQNPTAVFSRFFPGIRVVQYKDDPLVGGSWPVPTSNSSGGTTTLTTIKPLGASEFSIAAGAAGGSGVTPTTVPNETAQTFRIWLSPTMENRVADTGVSEIGPDRVTEAGCDIVRVNRWERWVPYRKTAQKKTYAVDVKLQFNGSRAAGVQPY